MTSTLIIFPENETTIPQNKKFTVKIAIANLNTGFFSDPHFKYYMNPQQLGLNGFINGHLHFMIQKIADESSSLPANKVEFFQGLTDSAKKGIISVDIETAQKAGLTPGRYRICTIVLSYTHQPIFMPVSKRGSQDDCIRITVR
ncbi:hypothetical protein Glove_169g57 [Diversispora epigaea]|uniref:Uncharacterized protein n=1 Tax=Diversispora epigaea TaxID=1348612 RepID=A0A397IU92_9GLOM|nr:hypothetical protein Glove_169g57 [Diversispora epigaea]